MTPATPALDRDEILRQTQSLRGLALHLVRDAAAAEDVVQSAWLAEVQGRRPADVPRSWWLRGVVRNLAARFARDGARRRRREETAARPEQVRVTADLAAVRAETHRRLTDAVLALEEPYRSAVLLRFFEGLAPAEIAERTGESAGTVRTRLHRAVEMLRARLDRDAAGDRRAWALALAPLVLAPAGVRGRGTGAVVGGAAVKATHGVWIAAALLVLVAAGAATFVMSEPGTEPLAVRDVASSAERDRPPALVRVPRAAQPAPTDLVDQSADAPPTRDADTAVDALP